MRNIIVLILLSFFVVACSQQPAPALPPAPTPPIPAAATPPPVAPPTETTPPPANTAAAVVPGTQQAFGQVNASSALSSSDITCDPKTQTVTFSFANDDTRTWEMDQQLGFNPPKDKVNIHVSINSYEVNSRDRYISDGVTYFGPNWPFSANCGGVKELAPGQKAVCTVQPVPLKKSTGLTAGFNEIFIKTPTSSHIVQFTCT